MKNLLFFSIVLISSNLYAKKIDSYTASNGKTYHIGDQIKLGRGSGQNGIFVYLEIGGFLAAAEGLNGRDVPQLDRNFSGRTVRVEKIKQLNSGQIIFTVSSKTMTYYSLDIENAIATCEIVDCTGNVMPVKIVNQTSKYDELAKLKELLDSGVLSKEEYEEEKEKLLK